MRNIVDGWVRRLGKAAKAKQPFQKTADQCMQFYTGTLGFMWDDKFQREYMNSKITPQFKLTIAKAFELVAIFGPTLYWKYPNRVCRSHERLELTPEAFGDPEDPSTMQIFEEIMRVDGIEQKRNDSRNQVMQKYLNYSQREQPEGLSVHSSRAITEALIKGRGMLVVKKYLQPASDSWLTGCFYETVDNLFIDPDAELPGLSDCDWIAIRHCDPVKKVERQFNLPKDSLDGKGHVESAESQSTNVSDHDIWRRREGKTGDTIVWYEIFSRFGVGERTKGVTEGMQDAFEDVVGDYAYICIAEGVDYPLNATSRAIQQATDEEVKDLFSWPEPYWTDGRFPVALLDFYEKPNSPWPLAPMAMGLGELMFLNVMMSLLCNRVYSSTRDIMVMLQSAAQDVKAKMQSGEYSVFIELNDSHNKSINEIVQFIKQPDVSFDLFRVIEMVMDMFDKRVGLTELLYGLNPGNKVSRTATDINVKQEMVSVRPEYMANKVEEWQSEAANLEKFCAAWNVKGEWLRPLLGMGGSYLWDTLIAEEDPEIIVREMRASVEAGSGRKPNRQKEAAFIQGAAGYIIPALEAQANVTGDTSGLNEWFKITGEAFEMDMSGLTLGPRTPQPPSEEEMQMQQQMQQIEMQKIQLELQKTQLDVEKSGLDVQGKQIDTEAKTIDLQLAQVEAQSELGASEGEMERQALEMEQKYADFEFDSMLKQLEISHQVEKDQLEMERLMATTATELDRQQQESQLKVETAEDLARIKTALSIALAEQKGKDERGRIADRNKEHRAQRQT